MPTDLSRSSREHEDITGCRDSWFLSRLERFLFQTGNDFVLHSVFCSTLPAWAGLEFLAGVKPWQGMDTLPELGCSRSTTGLLTPKQPCSASSQSIPTGKTLLCKALCPHSSPARMAQEMVLRWAGLRRETSLTLHPWTPLFIPGHPPASLNTTQIPRESRGGRV